MTLLVKNEEQMLAQQIEFHHALGVDHFIVTDNNSTDGTPDIIRRYQDKGWVVDVIEEHATDYEQKAWVDRMVELARAKHHADWIINADADEFWLPACGSFPELLKATRANVLAGELHSVLPEEGKPWQEWTKLVRYVDDFEAYGLSRFSMFERQNKKVLHRSRGYLQISMGNHKVSMLPHMERRADITIFHFNVRGREQFMQKMINGGKQLEQHKGRHGGRHWRYFYKLYKEGKLAEEYDRVVGTHVRDRLLSEGYIYEDTRLRDFLAKL
ncbi:MAG: glycosyltransferase family 2 protein [Bacteroidales bacterium]|nr:glycosyltransferase family 2 protein [Bacteroidales bacterium]